jgi:hypothetical protein
MLNSTTNFLFKPCIKNRNMNKFIELFSISCNGMLNSKYPYIRMRHHSYIEKWNTAFCCWRGLFGV